MKVRCKLCSHYDGKFCTVKKSGGKHPKVKANSRRTCAKFKVNPATLAAEADKEFMKREIPRFVPTWRYYATKKELKELGEEKGPKFIRTNPNV